MNRPEVYERSVNILLDAYNEGKLRYGTPCGCAVGNLIKSTHPVKKVCDEVRFHVLWAVALDYNPDWYFATIGRECGVPGITKEEAYNQIKSTGYTIREIYRIEKAFESSGNFNTFPQNQFPGLTAVLKLLAEIHEVDKESVKVNQTRLETIYNKFQLV